METYPPISLAHVFRTAVLLRCLLCSSCCCGGLVVHVDRTSPVNNRQSLETYGSVTTAEIPTGMCMREEGKRLGNEAIVREVAAATMGATKPQRMPSLLLRMFNVVLLLSCSPLGSITAHGATVAGAKVSLLDHLQEKGIPLLHYDSLANIHMLLFCVFVGVLRVICLTTTVLSRPSESMHPLVSRHRVYTNSEW